MTIYAHKVFLVVVIVSFFFYWFIVWRTPHTGKFRAYMLAYVSEFFDKIPVKILLDEPDSQTSEAKGPPTTSDVGESG